MNNFEYDESTRQYYEMAFQAEKSALEAANPVARRFTYKGFVSWSKGQFRRRKGPKEIELVTDLSTGRVSQLKRLALDQLATEVYGRDGESYFNGYWHSLEERLAADIRGLRS